jgi:hypothetical protein
MENYSKIAEKIGEDPFMHFKRMAEEVGLRRNTVSRYVKAMYAKEILVGPWMSVKPHKNYKEYVYLMDFSDPSLVFEGLKKFPYIVFRCSTSGAWNTLVVTGTPLNFSQLKGFESIVYKGRKGYTYTPKVLYSSWDECWLTICQQLDQFNPVFLEYKKGNLPSLNWSKDEWKLFYAFKDDMRKKITPILKTIEVSYETHVKWKKTLPNHCTIHTEFYPRGYKEYAHYCVLLKTDYIQSVTSLISLLPTTPVIMEMGDHVLAIVKITSQGTRKMVSMMEDMKKKGMIYRYDHALVTKDDRGL